MKAEGEKVWAAEDLSGLKQDGEMGSSLWR